MNLNPKKGQHVKVMFYDGLVEEGIVYFWSDDKSAIESNGSLLVIQKTLADIKCYQIIRKKSPEKKLAKPLKGKATDVFVERDLKPEKYYRDPSLRAASLAQLKIKMAEEERLRAREALTSFKPSGLEGNNYDKRRSTIPRRIQSVPEKFKSISQHPVQKTRRKYRPA